MTVLSWWSHLSGSCRLCVRSEGEREERKREKEKENEKRRRRQEKRKEEMKEKNHEKKLTEENILIHRR